jgi:hypothetical protein
MADVRTSGTDELQAVYARVCDSYQAIDDFRMRLLGLLPVATGTGVFLLLSGKAELIGTDDEETVQEAMGAIGAFGCLFTLGLFAFELFGIKKCHYLIEAGRRLERDLGVRGQFRCRPFDAAGFVNEPIASSVVYPVSMAAWLFLALVFVSGLWAALAAFAVLVAGCAVTVVGSRRIGTTHEREEQVLQALRRRGALTVDELSTETRLGTAWLERAVRRLKVRGDLERDGGVVRITPRRDEGSALDPPKSA